MDLFPLQLFPEGALDSSVITTVWVGVIIVASFNLRLGWVLSGLVVPGYLVPLLIARPFSAGVVVFEAILTYLLVIFLAGPLARLHGWGSFFGRDRFFALILVSVIVRVVMDGYALPVFGEWLNHEFGLNFDYRNNLHSFGLIIIALIANQFWKTGLIRGMVPLLVTVGLTFIVVRFVLMEFTNFRVSGLSYMFEDVTSSILASPKAYIIVLTTAFVASRMNLFYGWEFNGILIPSLLALQWYEPTKIVFSFAEAFLILGIGTMLLRLPVLRDANIEGARKLMLFFNISFLWKIFLSYGLIYFAPTLKVSDFFAFGYLLSTLMAMKMHDKAITLKLTWSTLTTSFVAILIASVIGFSLTLLPQTSTNQLQLTSAGATAASNLPLTELMKQEKRRMYGVIGQWQAPLPLEIESFRDAIISLRQARSIDDEHARNTSRILTAIGYETISSEGKYLILREKDRSRGWGLFVINTESQSDTLIEVPGPIHETGTLEAGLWLFMGSARALAIGGPRRTFDRDVPIEVLNDSHSPFMVFHKAFDRRDTIQIRGYRPSLRRAMTGSNDHTLDRDRIYITDQIPSGLKLGDIREKTTELDVQFVPLPQESGVRNASRGAFAELLLTTPALRRMAAGLAAIDSGAEQQESDQSFTGYLQDWLLTEAVRIAPRGSETYRPPDVYELLFFDEEIITPLLQVLAADYRDGQWTEEGTNLLNEISRRAAQYDYKIMRYRHLSTGQDYIILGASDTDLAPFWGTFVFRAGVNPEYLIQVPRPLYERNSLLFGLHIFDRVEAYGLLIAGAHPFANSDGSSDVTRYDNRVNLFNLVNQVLIRERGDLPTTVLQSRSQGVSPFRPVPAEDIVVSTNAGIGARSDHSPGIQAVLNVLEEDGLRIKVADGGADTSGLEAVNNYQALYQRAAVNKSFALLWLSPLILDSFADQFQNQRNTRDMTDSGITISSASLRTWLTHQKLASYTPTPDDRSLVRRYTNNRDIVALQKFVRDKQTEYVNDLESRQGFLVLRDNKGRVNALINLAPIQDSVLTSHPAGLDTVLSQFLNQRNAWMVFR